MSVATRYADHLRLADLPYFDLVDGRLRLDPACGPVIDVHTHLALDFVTGDVDLRREHPRTEHYLDVSRPIDLDVYINKNFDEADLKKMERDLTLLAFTSRGMRRTHTVPNLAREMTELRVESSVLLAIDFPFLSSNSERWLEASAGHDELITFGSVHPFQPMMERRLDRLVELGVRGIKMHPAVQTVPPDHPRTLKLVRACGDRGLPIFFHCGPVEIETAIGRRFSQVSRYEKAIAEHPHTTIILGHSGALQMDTAIGFANRYRNVWLETASQSLANHRRLVVEAPSDRLLMGSDWPFYHQSTTIAKALIATEGEPKIRAALLRDNARRLFSEKMPTARRG
jgi:predicted TIM-barrel fold metal-dependent hydrolase